MKTLSRLALPGTIRQVGGGSAVARVRDYGIVVSFLAIFAALSVTSRVFLSPTNLLDILDESAQVGIMACGGTLVFIAGGFDLSIGATFALSGMVAAAAAVGHVDPVIALCLGVGVGLGVGGLNALLTTVGRINAFITTIATQFVFYGVASVMTGGLLITVTNPSFTALGRGGFGGVTYQVVAWIAFALLCGFLLSRTSIGRYIYATGGNIEAARLSGVRVGLIRGATFVVSGFSAALAGILSVSRTATGEPTADMGIELTVIASIVIGGTSIYGGEGAIWRTILGVLLLTLIGNGFNLLNLDPTYQEVFQGIVILGAVAVDAWARRSKA